MASAATAAPVIGFRPMASADMDMMADWLARPHWSEWWGDPVEELAQLQGMLDGNDTTEPYVFSLDGADAGYIQVWFVTDARVEPWKTIAPWVMELPDDAVGVDLSLADPASLSLGIGTAVVAAFVTDLRHRGFTEIIIDPDPANTRAVRAYTKAGFRPVPELLNRTGDSLIMRHCKD